MSKVVLVDRDGVINHDKVDSVCSVADFQLIAGADKAIAQMCSLGFQVLVITNQACVGRGSTTMETIALIHHKMCAEIKKAGGEIADIFVCPHTPEDLCRCRKPLPGLIFQAHAKYHFVFAETWMVGDAARDIEAARNAGCRPARVLTGRGAGSNRKYENVPVFADLLAFSNFLTESNPISIRSGNYP